MTPVTMSAKSVPLYIGHAVLFVAVVVAVVVVVVVFFPFFFYFLNIVFWRGLGQLAARAEGLFCHSFGLVIYSNGQLTQHCDAPSCADTGLRHRSLVI